MPMVIAMREGEDFEVMKLLRGKSKVLSREMLTGIDVAEKLAELRTIIESLQDMMAPASTATTADVLRALHSSKLLELDPRILSYLKLKPNEEAAKDAKSEAAEEEAEEDTDELTKEVASMDAFLKCRASEFWGYYQYVNEESPFSTQQGIKGTEFERVLVILDDDEGTHTQFSYDKYLGIKALSDRDQANIAEGKETAVERTRRLFYVCCTRALKDLVVVLFTEDVQLAQRQVAALDLFPAESIHLENELGL
jgi:DNA helicase-2/ATP-dependent DNA helicase PcrA